MHRTRKNLCKSECWEFCLQVLEITYNGYDAFRHILWCLCHVWKRCCRSLSVCPFSIAVTLLWMSSSDSKLDLFMDTFSLGKNKKSNKAKLRKVLWMFQPWYLIYGQELLYWKSCVGSSIVMMLVQPKIWSLSRNLLSEIFQNLKTECFVGWFARTNSKWITVYLCVSACVFTKFINPLLLLT
jgi:hypothetical protein